MSAITGGQSKYLVTLIDRPADASDSTTCLYERAHCGDESAARALIERAVPSVRRWAHGRLPGYVRNDANTEDIVQDAVLRTLKGLKTFRHRTVGGLHAYLRTTVVNRIRDLIRGSRRHGIPEELGEHLRDPMPSPLESAIMRQGRDRFVEGLRHLRPAERQLIVWRIEMGYTADEIAIKLGKSKAAARMSLGRAMARLAKALNVEPTAF